MLNDLLAFLPETLINEDGGGFGFVCIWRADKSIDEAFKGTVGEWLLMPEHQSGSWVIDGGWGGPPGPIRVDWDGEKWINKGFPPYDGIKAFS